MENGKHILSVLVTNHSGVLSRVAGLFSRRGYNIDSLSVGETSNPAISRMTIVAQGDELIIDQIIKQLNKLHDVLYIKHLPKEKTTLKELALVKIKTTTTTRNEIAGIIDVCNGKIVDVATDALTVELTGGKGDIDTFLAMVNNYGIVEMTRTGIIALQKGNCNIREGYDEFSE